MYLGTACLAGRFGRQRKRLEFYFLIACPSMNINTASYMYFETKIRPSFNKSVEMNVNGSI
jgi:hypothetical protein